MEEVLLIALISIISGFLSGRAIKRFMDDKIEQWSFEYQVFGFGGMLVCVFGACYAAGTGLALLIDSFIT